MNKINIYDDPYCRYCGYYSAQKQLQQQQQQQQENEQSHWSDQLLNIYFDDDPNIKREETIEHYLFDCPAFNQERNELFNNINQTIGKENELEITIQLLLTGYPCNKWDKRKAIVKHTISFIKQTNRMDI